MVKFTANQAYQAKSSSEFDGIVFDFRNRLLKTNTAQLENTSSDLIKAIDEYINNKSDVNKVWDYYSYYATAVYSVKQMPVERYRGIDASDNLEMCISFTDKVKEKIRDIDRNRDKDAEEFVASSLGHAISCSTSLRRMAERYEEQLNHEGDKTNPFPVMS